MHRSILILTLSLLPSAWLAAEFAVEGVVRPAREALLGAPELGRVTAVPVQAGEQVEAGALLVQLDSRRNLLERDRARLVAASQAELELATQRAGVIGAEAADLEALLADSQRISREAVNQKVLAAALARTEQTQLAEREALEVLAVELAEAALTDRAISAPFAGTIVEVLPEEGEILRPGDPVARLVDLSAVIIECFLPASAAASLRVGDKAQVTLPEWAGPSPFMAEIDFLAPVVDAASGLRKVTLRYPDPERRLTPGVTAQVVFSAAL